MIVAKHFPVGGTTIDDKIVIRALAWPDQMLKRTPKLLGALLAKNV